MTDTRQFKEKKTVPLVNKLYMYFTVCLLRCSLCPVLVHVSDIYMYIFPKDIFTLMYNTWRPSGVF